MGEVPAGEVLFGGEEGEVFGVLLAAEVGLEADGGDGFFLADGGAGVEEAGVIGFFPGGVGADDLPGEDAVSLKCPTVPAPGGGLDVAVGGVVGAAVGDDDLVEALFAVEDEAVVLAEDAAGDDVVIEDVVEECRAATGGGRCRSGRAFWRYRVRGPCLRGRPGRSSGGPRSPGSWWARRGARGMSRGTSRWLCSCSCR